MKKAIACILFASALCAAPVLANGQDIANAPSTSESAQATVLVGGQDNIITAPATDQFAQAPQNVESASPPAAVIQDVVQAQTSETVESQTPPITGYAVELTPVVEFATSPIAVTAAAEQPVSAAQSVAAIVPSTDESARAIAEKTDMASVNLMISKLDIMSGKEIFDQYGALIGTIIGMDEETNLAEIALVNGGSIALMPEAFTDMGFGVVAYDLVRSDVVTAADQTDNATVSTIVAPE
jgi:hypothetical protein